MPLNSKQKKELKALAQMPDDTIDTSDIPEIESGSRGVRGRFATRLISIRLNTADIDAASRLAEAKGLAYQTYIKSVLHEALKREAKRA
jgi:predicted DNA binding CopG/RHH family protein